MSEHRSSCLVMFREGHKAAGETEQMPAEKPPSPEYSNLEDLMGYLSTTERMRKQELNEQQRNATLEQRARSEEWYLRTEVCFILDPLKMEPMPVRCCAAPMCKRRLRRTCPVKINAKFFQCFRHLHYLLRGDILCSTCPVLCASRICLTM